MDGGKLSVTKFDAEADASLGKLGKITFIGDREVEFLFRSGKASRVKVNCYWNVPAKFSTDTTAIFYGDCSVLEVVWSIERSRWVVELQGNNRDSTKHAI